MMQTIWAGAGQTVRNGRVYDLLLRLEPQRVAVSWSAARREARGDDDHVLFFLDVFELQLWCA